MKKCATCGGQGAVVRTIRMGPMIQQMQQPCSACEGQGYTYKMKRTTEVLEVNVNKGAQDGHKVSMQIMFSSLVLFLRSKFYPNALPNVLSHDLMSCCSQITFHNKADEIPDGDAGDVVFVLKEKPHEVFKRHGADL